MELGNRYFQKVNHCLGWGDPDAGLWFIGIEEGAEYSCTDEIDRNIPDGTEFMTINPGDTNTNRKRHNAYPVMSYMSKFASRLTDAYHDNWSAYRTNILWQKGSRICQANLYPLGKPKRAIWPPDNLKLFGLEGCTQREYINYVRETRFKYLKQSWDRHAAIATICFGITCWDDFRRVFSLELSDKENFLAGKVELYHTSRIALIPHFSSRVMSDEFVKKIADEISARWKVKLPSAVADFSA